MMVTYAVHIQLPRAGSEAHARLQSKRRFTCQATDFGKGAAEPVRLGSSGRFAWQLTIFGSSAAELRKRFSSADQGLNASGSRRHRAWQLKQRNSGQPGFSNLLQYLCLQDGRVFILHAQYFFSYRQPASVGQPAILCCWETEST